MNATPGWRPARRVRGFDDVFERYLRWLVRRSFATVWIHRDAASLPQSGYVAAANHSSWWDGFLPFLLHRHGKPSRPFALMMSEAELRKFPFFRWGGAFSVDASSPRAARDAILYAGDQARSGAAVWIFPQGRFASGASNFSSGFVHAARHGGVSIVPIALRFTMLQRQRPEAFIDVAPPLTPDGRNAARACERAVAERLARIDAIAAGGNVAAHFVPFVLGSAGVDRGIASAIRVWRRWF